MRCPWDGKLDFKAEGVWRLSIPYFNPDDPSHGFCPIPYTFLIESPSLILQIKHVLYPFNEGVFVEDVQKTLHSCVEGEAAATADIAWEWDTKGFNFQLFHPLFLHTHKTC